jgi:hypothetical protein
MLCAAQCQHAAPEQQRLLNSKENNICDSSPSLSPERTLPWSSSQQCIKQQQRQAMESHQCPALLAAASAPAAYLI